jgi:PAS domain S-box-containing protein
MGTEKKSAELINGLMAARGDAADAQDSPTGVNKLAGTFSDLIDVMDIAMWQLDLDYRVVGFNQKAKEIYGEAALGDFCFHAAAKLDTICDDCPAREVYEGKPSGRSERKRVNAAGEEIYIDHIATPIKGADGNITGSLVLIIDITRHKRQEVELRAHRSRLEEMVVERTWELEKSQAKFRDLYEQSSRAEKLYRSLISSSADAIVIYNLKGEVQYISPSFTEIFGWRLGELKGRQIPFVPEAEKESSITEIRRLLKTGEPTRNFQTRRRTKDGRLLDIYLSASKYDDNDGNPIGILVILKDVTDTKAMELQLHRAQKIEALGTLAGGIAHDFNNLLMGIQGNASLLLLECDDLDQPAGQANPKEKLKNIEKYVRRGEYLTKQLLGLSKGGKYEVKTTDINHLIAECAGMFGETKKEITINRHLREDTAPVEVDQGQLEQVLLNLFVNAAQAMPGGGDLFLETRNVVLDAQVVSPYNLPPGNYIKIAVTDTGTGIPDDVKDRIFDPFFTTKEKERGTGLGLASAYGIISNHGGFINVKSQVGQGATFTIHLPASEKSVLTEKVADSGLHHGDETILLVDDEEMVTEVGQQLLERLGYNVKTASSGRAALGIYGREKDTIDLVILDMIMPGLSGSETFDRLTALNPQVKTLLSSGYSLNGQATDILNRGCNGFIQKPFNINELSQKIREVLDAGQSPN